MGTGAEARALRMRPRLVGASFFGRFRRLCYFRLEAQFAVQRAGTGPMRAGGDMGPVARRRGAQATAVQQVVERPVSLAAVLSAWGDGADCRVRPRGPPSSPSESAVGRMVDLC